MPQNTGKTCARHPKKQSHAINGLEDSADTPQINERGYDLFPFQRETVRAIRKRFKRRALVALDMGLGKTAVALDVIARNPRKEKSLVVCPASVKYQWQEEASRFAGLSADVIDGTTPIKHLQKPLQSPIVIINYDVVKYHVDYLRSIGFDLVVLDECQAISGPTSQRSIATCEIARDARDLLAMSGTPLMNRPFELFVILNLLWPDEFDSHFDFGFLYCQAKYNRGKWDFKGAANLDELHARLIEKGMIRRTKAEVMKDLPAKMRQVDHMDLKDWAQYHEANHNFGKWVRAHHPKKATRALKMEQLTKINYLLMLVGKLKMRSINTWIENFLDSSDEKIVVFCHHLKMMSALHRRFPNSVFINGSVPSKKRRAAVNQFQQDKKTRIILGNGAMTAGVDGLQRVASTLAFTECFWRPSDHKQAGDRISRIGTKFTTWEHWLMVPGTIEEWMCEILQNKQENIGAVLDGGEAEQLSVLDMLLEKVEKESKR